MKKFLSFALIFMLTIMLTSCDSQPTMDGSINTNATTQKNEGTKTEVTTISYDDIKANATLLYPAEYDGWSYNVYSDITGTYDKFVEITDSDIHSSDVRVPGEIEGYPVVALAEYAMYRNHLTRLEIPDSVIYIGESCFEFCENLSSLTLSKNLTEVCKRAFYHTRLTKLELPSSLRIIESDAFHCPGTYDTYINKLVIPEGVTYLGESVANVHDVYIMNPSVKFDGESFSCDNIYGYIGSTAATYASEWDCTFVAIEE